MRGRWIVAGVTAAALTALLAPVAMRPSPRLVWNASDSVPIGFYRIDPFARGGRTPAAIGDLVLVRTPEPLATWMAERGYVGRDTPLLKRVAALAPSRVCRDGSQVTVDGRPITTARATDRSGRPLPVWTGCRDLVPGEAFVLNADHADSLDGRYFGPLPIHRFEGRATRVHAPWERRP